MIMDVLVVGALVLVGVVCFVGLALLAKGMSR